MKFSSKLKALRESRNLTQAELAERLEVSKSTISMYELGNREPDFEMLEAIADTFNVRMSDLIDKETPIKRVFSSDDEALKFALFGENEGITDAQFEEVKQFAKFVKERDKK